MKSDSKENVILYSKSIKVFEHSYTHLRLSVVREEWIPIPILLVAILHTEQVKHRISSQFNNKNLRAVQLHVGVVTCRYTSVKHQPLIVCKHL